MVTWLTLTTGAFTGTYWVDFCCDIGNITGGDVTSYQFVDTTNSLTIGAGTTRQPPTLAAIETTSVASFYQIAFTGAAKSFAIQYLAVNGTALIQNARIRVWRAA
jgi:hypothetical protein